MAQTMDAPLPILLGGLDITIGATTFEDVEVYLNYCNLIGQDFSNMYQIYEWSAYADLGNGIVVWYYGNNTTEDNCYDWASGGNPVAAIRSLLSVNPI